MAVACPQPAVAQIGMGIELQQHELRMALGDGGHGAAADGVFATQHQWLEA